MDKAFIFSFGGRSVAVHLHVASMSRVSPVEEGPEVPLTAPEMEGCDETALPGLPAHRSWDRDRWLRS